MLKKHSSLYSYVLLLIGLVILIAPAFILPGSVQAQDESPPEKSIQEVTGYLHTDSALVYELLEAKAGDTIYAYVENVSGNLDPFLSIHSEEEAWIVYDDDGGGGSAAIIKFEIPDDNAYWLQVENCCGRTSGDFRLLVSLNAPEVLTGQAEPAGSEIAVYSHDKSVIQHPVVEVREGNIADAEEISWLDMSNMVAGDTFYAHIQTTSGDLTPCLTLTNALQKTITRADNAEGSYPITTLEYTFLQGGDYKLYIHSCDSGNTGDYRLLAGLNVPEILDNNAEPTEQKVFDVPVAIQEITGYLRIDTVLVYELPEAKAGDTIYAYMENTSGNLDPFLSIHSEEQAWIAYDDDGGGGLTATLEFEIPDDHGYWLQVENCCDRSFGHFRLLVGLNAPEVLTGQVEPTGQDFALLNADKSTASSMVAIEVRENSIAHVEDGTWLDMTEMSAGDRFYAHIEATSGDLTPCLTLTTAFEKIITKASGSEDALQSATLEYEFPQNGNYKIYVDNCGSATSGDYRLIAGLNVPGVLEVLEKKAEPLEQTVFDAPVEIQVGLELEQITDVDQISENFSVVAVLRAGWNDPTQAFNPIECDCTEKVFADRQLTAYFDEHEDLRWPEFTFTNQQGERVPHNRALAIGYAGNMRYVERFSGTFQAPAFFFGAFPFDEQHFWMRLESFGNNSDKYFFTIWDNDEYNRYGDQLGEEEWVIVPDKFAVTADEEHGSSVFSFDLYVVRHLDFYIYRILIPILLIVALSWITFLIKDYDARIGASSGNLLIFIAFNFTIGDDLPRLGYLTFLDTFLVICFIVTSLVVAINVWFKRLDVAGKSRLATEINRQLIWMYPLFYIIFTIILAIRFNVFEHLQEILTV